MRRPLGTREPRPRPSPATRESPTSPWMGLCPFHTPRQPFLEVDPTGTTFRCGLGCMSVGVVIEIRETGPDRALLFVKRTGP